MLCRRFHNRRAAFVEPSSYLARSLAQDGVSYRVVDFMWKHIDLERGLVECLDVHPEVEDLATVPLECGGPAAIVLAALYPFAKRVIHLPQAVLGIAFGWGTIMAWTASRGVLESAAWLTFAATICWAIAYDTIYALQDMDDDRRIGVKSSALYFGSAAWLAVGSAGAMMLLLLGIGSEMMGIGAMAYGVLAAVGVFLAKQVNELRNPISSERAFELFRQHVWIGTAILAGLIMGFL